MRHSKIIVWGSKPDTKHTHAFVHEAVVRAAEYMGIPVYWMDNRDVTDETFFDDALIISEQWLVFRNGISNKLPLRPTSTYIIHYLGNKGPVEGNPGANLYLGKVGRLIDFRFACNWGVNGVEKVFQVVEAKQANLVSVFLGAGRSLEEKQGNTDQKNTKLKTHIGESFIPHSMWRCKQRSKVLHFVIQLPLTLC